MKLSEQLTTKTNSEWDVIIGGGASGLGTA
jgi:glycerol-3-phosphate dehydrogenase